MDKIITASNIKAAGVVTVAALLASNFTAGKGTLIQGGALFAATALVLGLVVPKI